MALKGYATLILGALSSCKTILRIPCGDVHRTVAEKRIGTILKRSIIILIMYYLVSCILYLVLSDQAFHHQYNRDYNQPIRRRLPWGEVQLATHCPFLVKVRRLARKAGHDSRWTKLLSQRSKSKKVWKKGHFVLCLVNSTQDHSSIWMGDASKLIQSGKEPSLDLSIQAGRRNASSDHCIKIITGIQECTSSNFREKIEARQQVTLPRPKNSKLVLNMSQPERRI